MRTGRTQRAFGTMAVAAALLALFVGCRAPGTSFGHDPLQLRFGTATLSALKYAESQERRHDVRPYPEEQHASRDAIVIASSGDASVPR